MKLCRLKLIGVFKFIIVIILLISLISFSLVVYSYSTPPKSVLIITPHPDDETLGVGGHIVKFIKEGYKVYTISLTLGDGYSAAVALKNKSFSLKYMDYINFGKTRSQEIKEALSKLGVKNDCIFSLGFPDGGLSTLWLRNWDYPYTSSYTGVNYSPYEESSKLNLPYKGENIYSELEKIIKNINPEKIFIVDAIDIHNDHWAAYCFSIASVLGLMTEKKDFNPEIYTYIIHFNNFPYPKGYDKLEKLIPNNIMKKYNNTFQIYPLSKKEIDLKEKAILKYETQLPLMKDYLLSFVRKNEIFGKPLTTSLNGNKALEIKDSLIDVSSYYRNTSANIKKIFIKRENGYMNIEMITNGNITNKYSYNLRAFLFSSDFFKRLDISYPKIDKKIEMYIEENKIVYNIPFSIFGSSQYIFLGADTNLNSPQPIKSFIDATHYYILDLKNEKNL